MNLSYKAGEDLKKGDGVELRPDGKMYRSTSRRGLKVMLKDVAAGEKVEVNIGGR